MEKGGEEWSKKLAKETRWHTFISFTITYACDGHEVFMKSCQTERGRLQKMEHKHSNSRVGSGWLKQTTRVK